ncbi:hypothetical protein TIFTF001_014635 [Ficus carica]|uniref:SNRNP25 ubiquitin-like domain-containing protein n=1 Tax=Ficus carica TaxID=3494 RepID=A0AA88D4B1_FICCA|nr:hypothetical protein TIFTF001_014635 [Ficus carica]
MASLERVFPTINFPRSPSSSPFSNSTALPSQPNVCLNVEIAKTATVDELKQAVEAVFSHLPQNGPGKISWPYVWGHFCLSYNGQKLVIDTDCIRDYGVKDGDQLHFMRHVSMSYNMVRKRSKHKNMSRLPSISCDDEEQNDKEHSECGYKGKGKLHHYVDQGCFIGQREIKLTNLLGEWFSRCKIASLGKKRVEDVACPSRVPTGIMEGFKKIVRRCGDKCYSRKATILLSHRRRYP